MEQLYYLSSRQYVYNILIRDKRFLISKSDGIDQLSLVIGPPTMIV